MKPTNFCWSKNKIKQKRTTLVVLLKIEPIEGLEPTTC
jgi:hypothetical protein